MYKYEVYPYFVRTDECCLRAPPAPHRHHAPSPTHARRWWSRRGRWQPRGAPRDPRARAAPSSPPAATRAGSSTAHAPRASTSTDDTKKRLHAQRPRMRMRARGDDEQEARAGPRRGTVRRGCARRRLGEDEVDAEGEKETTPRRRRFVTRVYHRRGRGTINLA